MKVIQTTAPIDIQHLKEYFADKTIEFVVDYEQSELQGSKLLTYVGNLDLPIDIVNFDGEFLREYFHSTSIVSVPSLELEAIKILFEYKGIRETEDYAAFIADNEDILREWSQRLDSLSLYNLYTVNAPELTEHVESYPKNSTDDLTGINFVSLLKHTEFYVWFANIDESNLQCYTHYFDDYMFKGHNLYSFWANENNPMFLLTWGIANNEVDADSYVNAKHRDIEELKNATSA